MRTRVKRWLSPAITYIAYTLLPAIADRLFELARKIKMNSRLRPMQPLGPQDFNNNYGSLGHNSINGASLAQGQRPLRIVASGTLFQTLTLSMSSYPEESSTTRAQSVRKTRGGSASTLVSLLAQFPNVEAVLVAALGGNEEGLAVLRELEREGVLTRYCKIWEGLGVPSAWVLHAGPTLSSLTFFTR